MPDAWLEPVPGAETPDALRAAYVVVPLRPARDARRGCPGRAPHERDRRLPYQYVVLRCVPRVDREEFLNVGVVLYCQETTFLQAAWHVDRERLAALDPRLDLDAGVRRAGLRRRRLRAATSAAARRRSKPPGTRFGFLKAPRSTVLQPAPVHGGMTTDPARQLEHLLERLVG